MTEIMPKPSLLKPTSGGNIDSRPLPPTTAQGAFEKIYQTKAWGDGESLSGVGSYVKYTTNVRKMVSHVIRKYGIKSLLDAPCGDFNWQPMIKDLRNINYTGVDIVPYLISRHSRKYLGIDGFRFSHWNMAEDILPKGRFDIIMTRDMIQHNSLEDGLKIIRNIEQSGAKYLLTNFHDNQVGNTNVPPGGYYPINVMLPPFSFPEPIVYVLEGSPDSATGVHRKFMCLFEIKNGKLLGQGNGKYFRPSEDSFFRLLDFKTGVQLPNPEELSGPSPKVSGLDVPDREELRGTAREFPKDGS
ncbi:MAG: hypothetical protein SGCHY_004125 [Lobulomycetales sp.]